MRRKLTSICLALVLGLVSTSYGADTTPPTPATQTWAVSPSSSGLTSIYMKATTATDPCGPVQYYFECTNDPCKSRDWNTDQTYTATGLTRGTLYRFRVRARDGAGNPNNWSAVRIEVAGSVRLDMNASTDESDANTEDGWKAFIIANSGSEVNAVTIDLTGSIKSARRLEPNSVLGYGTVYTEQVYRDFIYGLPRSGITITLWGLGVNRDCNVTLWAFDAKSEPNRVADWYGNEVYMFTTDFKGEDPTLWPTTLNPCHDAYKTTATVQADALGRLVLESFRNTRSPSAAEFAFVNGLVVAPKGTYNEPNQAQRPVPFDETENVAVATSVSWKPSTLADGHDVYFGTDFDDVNDASRISPRGVLVSRNQAGTSYNPYGSGDLEVGQTYYWRIDEVNSPSAGQITKGEIWSFTTITCATIENFSSYTTDLYKIWEDWHYNQTAAAVFLQTISEGSKYVHGGSGQSMKFEYTNADVEPPDVLYNYAESEATIGTGTNELNIDPNWLRMAVKSLSVWFRGTTGNDTDEPMYVKLTDDASNSAAVFYDGDPEDTALEEWQEWVINMNNFTADMNADNTYDANVTDSNDPCGVTGGTNGYGSMWYYYPESKWWNIWLDNGRYDRHRKKDIWITLIVKRRNVGQAAKAEFLMGGATALWMADPNGSIRPPLPSDVNALTEPNYIDRTAHEPNVFYPTASYQIINLHITLPWNPRWVFLDIRGYNFDIIGGIIRHRCRSYLNLGRMKKIALGFGYDVVPRGSGAGTVYFDDIGLCSTRCALGKRPCGLALTDYAPGGAPSGDCLIDYKEIQIMAATWLARDSFIKTKNPEDANLVLYYPMDEGDGNKVYSDPCNAKWTGTFYQRWTDPPGNAGVSWATPGAPIIGGDHCVYINGIGGSRISCRSADLGIGPTSPDINAITLSIWAKWLGPRYFDSYLLSKGQGFMGKRGGWNENSVIWTFWISADVPGAIGLGHYTTAGPDVISPQGTMDSFIGQWVHVAATYPNPSGIPADANSYARIYLNGGQVASGPWRFSHGDDSTIDLTIGCSQDVNAQTNAPTSFYGYLDEVRIYNHALEPNEIAYLADTTPDGNLMIPIPSAAEIYEEEPEGSRVVNFKDFALVANNWLVGFEWP